MKPIKRHILFCTGGDCKKGNKKAYKQMKKELKKAKQPFVRCSKTKCLGACKNSPVMVVYPDGTWYSGVTKPDEIKAVVDTHIVNGTPVKKPTLHQMPNHQVGAKS